MKTSSLALASLLLVGGLAVPVLAADSADFDSDYLTTQLQHRGVNAVDVYENGDNVIRAEVKLADGSTVFQYFYEDTLAPVKAPAVGNTRVLSKLDTGAKAAPVTTDSLLYDGDHSN